MGRPFKGPHPPDKHPASMGGRCGASHARREVKNGGRLRRRSFQKSYYESACSKRRTDTGRPRRAEPSQAHLNATLRWRSDSGHLPLAAPIQQTECHLRVAPCVWVPVEDCAQTGPL